MSQTPVVILAGGRGSRLGEHTDLVPKPMVKVQGVPIIERIMNNFGRNGFHRFIISVGYKGDVIAEYFKHNEDVVVVDTGVETQTAGRILGVKELLKEEHFLACYGDGLTDYHPADLVLEHRLRRPRSICTMLTVHPTGRFGEISFDSRGMVTKFSEKPMSKNWINGGYFCFSDEIFDYLSKDKVLETDVFGRLVSDGRMFCDSYEGFWHSLDTPKDLAELNNMRLP